jgi:hypothetical protein
MAHQLSIISTSGKIQPLLQLWVRILFREHTHTQWETPMTDKAHLFELSAKRHLNYAPAISAQCAIVRHGPVADLPIFFCFMIPG